MENMNKIEFEFSSTNKTIYYILPEVFKQKYPTYSMCFKQKGRFDKEFVGLKRFILYIPGNDLDTIEKNIHKVINYLDENKTKKRKINYSVLKTYHNSREIMIVHRWLEIDGIKIYLRTYKVYADKQDDYESLAKYLGSKMFIKKEYIDVELVKN